MPSIAENKKAHPEWYVDPKTLTAEEKRFLSWQALQFNTVGPGTINDAWTQAGTGPHYFSHVAAARAQIELWSSRNVVLKEAGRDVMRAPWNLTKNKAIAAAQTAPNVSGAVFGGTTTKGV